MLAELPFITADELAAEYKPGANVTVKGALRTLREKEVISDGFDVRPRSAGGRVKGTQHLYSSLNVDAVSLFRRGDQMRAQQLARRARQLERRNETRQLAERFGQAFIERGALHEAIMGLARDAGIQGSLRLLTERTQAERQEAQEKLGLSRTKFGRISRIHGDLAELRLEDGLETRIAVSDLSPMNVLTLGAGVALRWETLGGGMTLLKTTAAFDLDEPATAGHPYDRPLPTEEARVDLTDALSPRPTIRRPRRIEIAGPH